MRLAFLFNHDQIHQVGHSLPIAIALKRRGLIRDLTLLTSSELLTREVHHQLRRAKISLPLVQLSIRNSTIDAAAALLDHLIPAGKLALYGDNLDLFRSFDGLVVAEKTSALLKSHYRLDTLKIIHTRHGAGDRAIGFDATSQHFDHVLAAGPLIKQRLIADAGIDAAKISIVGYPKFDLLDANPPPIPEFANVRPIILYNPHVAPHLSSWYRHGRAILDHFMKDRRFNLIFAPHNMLFHRRINFTISPPGVHLPGRIAQRWHAADNIMIDLGSARSSDMTYTKAADIYLGDASSQIYEFLLRPRPCIFVNSHRITYQGDKNFRHWTAGKVIADPYELGGVLDKLTGWRRSYDATQRQLFSEHIDLTGEASSIRAARVIETVMLPDRAPRLAPA